MTNIEMRGTVRFPEFSGIRCLMMPYRQGDPTSIPDTYSAYSDIVASVFIKKGALGFLTIDESPAIAGQPHRGARARYGRALHTEAGKVYPLWCWGQGGWGGETNTTLDLDVRVLLANNLSDSCALWDAKQEDTSADGDIGHLADMYPYDDAILMKAGEVYEIGVLTPHESLPVPRDYNRQFLRIVSSGVYGREEYFTRNPLM
jgi:hypothetical protein